MVAIRAQTGATNPEARWEARRTSALALRAAIAVVPLVVGLGAALVFGSLVSRPSGGPLLLCWWAGTLGVSALGVAVVARQLERVLPLVRNHMAHLQTVTDRAVRRLAKRLEPENIEGLSIVMTADAMGRYGAHPVLIVASHDDNPSGADSTARNAIGRANRYLTWCDMLRAKEGDGSSGNGCPTANAPTGV